MMERNVSREDGMEPVPACEGEEHASSGRREVSDAASLSRATRMLRAAGDEARLRLLEKLSQGEMCVTEIAAESGEGISTVSQRLKVLRNEGLVVGRREGKHVFYSLADGHVSNLILSVLAHAGEERL